MTYSYCKTANKAVNNNNIQNQNVMFVKIYAKTTEQPPSPPHCLFSDKRYELLQHKTLCLCLCFTGASNPWGNKQKISVRAHEAPGRELWPPWLDMLMLTGVPVTESCKHSPKTRWLVSRVCQGSCWRIWAQQSLTKRVCICQHFLVLTFPPLLCRMLVFILNRD